MSVYAKWDRREIDEEFADLVAPAVWAIDVSLSHAHKLANFCCSLEWETKSKRMKWKIERKKGRQTERSQYMNCKSCSMLCYKVVNMFRSCSKEISSKWIESIMVRHDLLHVLFNAKLKHDIYQRTTET